jgi:hypothetical protein
LASPTNGDSHDGCCRSEELKLRLENLSGMIPENHPGKIALQGWFTALVAQAHLILIVFNLEAILEANTGSDVGEEVGLHPSHARAIARGGGCRRAFGTQSVNDEPTTSSWTPSIYRPPVCFTRWQGVRMHALRTMSAMDVLERRLGHEAREAKNPQSD